MEVLGWLPSSSLLRAEVLGQSSPSFLIAGGDGRVVVTTPVVIVAINARGGGGLQWCRGHEWQTGGAHLSMAAVIDAGWVDVVNVNSAKDESVIEVYMTPWKCSPVMVVVVDGIDRPPLMSMQRVVITNHNNLS